MIVPAGTVLRYGYARMEQFRGFRSYGAIQWDVVKEYAGRYSELDGDQLADAPLVEWTDGGFVVLDGRHRFMALLGAGYGTILVRWREDE